MKTYIITEERLKQIVFFAVQHAFKLSKDKDNSSGHVYRGQIDEFIDLECSDEQELKQE